MVLWNISKKSIFQSVWNVETESDMAEQTRSSVARTVRTGTTTGELRREGFSEGKFLVRWTGTTGS
jgi:hypothetical protein